MNKVETIRAAIKQGTYPSWKAERQAAERLADLMERGWQDGWFGRNHRSIDPAYLAGYDRGRDEKRAMGIRC